MQKETGGNDYDYMHVSKQNYIKEKKNRKIQNLY